MECTFVCANGTDLRFLARRCFVTTPVINGERKHYVLNARIYDPLSTGRITIVAEAAAAAL